MERMEDRINKDGPRPLYLIHGENEFLREQHLKELIRIFRDQKGLELEVFEGAAPLTEVLLSASMLSLFSQGKLILQRNPQWLKKAADADDLLEWLAHSGDDHVLVFTLDSKPDGRQKLTKTLKARDMLVDCPLLREWDLPPWIVGRFKARGKRISREAAEILLARAGSNQAVLDGEVAKICLFAGDQKEVTGDMVEQLAASSALSGIFDLLDAFSAQDGPKTLKHYRSLVQMRESEIKILFMLARQIRILYGGKLLRNAGHDDGSIVKTLGINPYVWKKARAHALRMDEGFLRQALYEAGELDHRMKTGRGRPEILMEMFLVAFCQGAFPVSPDAAEQRLFGRVANNGLSEKL